MKLKNSLLSALLLAGILIGFAGIIIGAKSALAIGLAEQSMVGQPAPPIDLKTIDGKRVDLSELRGKIVVVHFAASWSPFCNVEAQHLESLYGKYRERGVQVFIVDVKETEEIARKWAESRKFTFPVLLDLDGKTAERYAPAGVQPHLPRDQVPIASNLIIDQQGKIHFFSLLDSVNFDAKLVQVIARLEELLLSAKRSTEIVSVIPPLLVRLSPGGKAQARFAILIANGFHIQANPVSDQYLVPTRLELQGARGVYTDTLKYPPGERYHLEGASQDLLTYAGTVELLVPLRAAEDAMPGDWILRGKLRYQACDARSCLPPTSLDLSVPVHVTPTRTKIPLFK